jgi:GT2 family glycosyltransferase
MEYIFSIIIPTYNRIDVLKVNLSLLLKQSFQMKYEIVVIDDCSTDGTQLYFDQKGADLKNVVYIRNDNNLGRAKSRNIGIKRARGKYILMVDDDISVNSLFLSEHYKMHTLAKDPVVVAGAIKPSPYIPNTAVNNYLNWHHEWCYREMLKNRNSLPFNFCKTANLSLLKQVFNSVGLFDEAFIEYGGEDTELGCRIFNNNIRLLFAEDAIGYHYHNETVDGIIKKFMQQARTIKYFCKLHPHIKTNVNSFFTGAYHKNKDTRSIIYNIAKLIIFTDITRILNKTMMEQIDGKNILRQPAIKYFLPILKIQYQHYAIRRMEIENRY